MSLSLSVVPRPVFLISGLSLRFGDVDVFFLQSRLFAVRHIHYPVNPSNDYFHTAAVVPSSDRRLLTTEATATLVSAFILSRLDYCNSLLSGCPRSLILRLQKVQNNAARLILGISKREHLSDLLAVYTAARQLRSSSDNSCLPSSICPYSILWSKVFRILRPF